MKLTGVFMAAFGLVLVPGSFAGPVPSPYDLKPVLSRCFGVCVPGPGGYLPGEDGGGGIEWDIATYHLRHDGIHPLRAFVVFSFPKPFTSGPGFDFAVSTGACGPAAGRTRFRFYFKGRLVGKLVATLQSNQLFECKLPVLQGVWVDHVKIQNWAAILPANSDDATLGLQDMGAAHPAH